MNSCYVSLTLCTEQIHSTAGHVAKLQTVPGAGGTAADPASASPVEGLRLKENEIYGPSIKILKDLRNSHESDLGGKGKSVIRQRQTAAGLDNSHKSGRGEEIKPNQTQREKKKIKKKVMKRF